MRLWKPPLFTTDVQRQRVELFKRKAARYEQLLQRMLDEALPEQKARLRLIRDIGPWDAEWPALNRRQTERANEMILQLREYRVLKEEIRELERTLPPKRGWHRLRYADPLAVTVVLAGLSIALNAYRLYEMGGF